MKTHNIYIALILVLALIGCQKEEVEQLEASTEVNQIIRTNATEITPSNKGFTIDPVAEASKLEFSKSLQWTSFLAARTLKNSASARTDFHNGSDLIGIYDMNELLDPDGAFPNFNEEFRRVLVLYAAGRPDLEHEPDRPLTGGGNGMPVSAQVQAYLDFVLVDHCIELFVPNGLNMFSTEYSTTGHPLNGDTENFGYRRLAVPIWNDGSFINVVDIPILNELYVQNTPNVIIARPDRSGSFNAQTAMSEFDTADPCTYSQYAVNFDLFLNQ